MSESFIAQQALVSPITHAGRVVYNAQRDWLETRYRKRKGGGGAHAAYAKGGFGDPGCHTIQQFELTMRNCGNRYLQWTPSDTDVRVFSSTNGMKIPNSVTKELKTKHPTVKVFQATDTPRLRLLKRDNLQFGGVASNRAIYDPHNNANEEHLAVQVGGLTTIYNTGDTRINTGDVVLWDMPVLNGTDETSSIRIAGVPKNKLLFSTKALDPKNSFQQEEDDYYHMMYDYRRDTGQGSPKAQAANNEERISDAEIFIRMNRRIIGRAFSTAGPAKPFDILLGRYMC
jgi:hypothetical protein